MSKSTVCNICNHHFKYTKPMVYMSIIIRTNPSRLSQAEWFDQQEEDNPWSDSIIIYTDAMIRTAQAVITDFVASWKDEDSPFS